MEQTITPSRRLAGSTTHTRAPSMNIYDPADRIRYVHLSPEVDSWSPVPGNGPRCIELPLGYANQSPRTRLGHRSTGRLRESDAAAADGA